MAETFDSWYQGRPILSLVNGGHFDFWYEGQPVLQLVVSPGLSPTGIPSAEAVGTPHLQYNQTITCTGIASTEAFGTQLVLLAQTITCTGIASAEAFGVATLTFVLTTQDIIIVWAYAKRNNAEDYEWVAGSGDASKDPEFRDYEVRVYSKPDAPSTYVLRRTVSVIVETYLYTASMNIADAGLLMRYVRLEVRTRENTGFNSPVKAVEAVVVS